MKQHVTAVLLCACGVLGGSPVVADEFTLYVVRHAEKAVAKADPPLNEMGQQRAHMLAEMLQNAEIKALYSTPYQRTQETVQPLALRLGLTVQSYRPGDSQALIRQLKQAAENALVVGHSNTVPALVRALGGTSENLTEQDYGDLFQLTLHDCDAAKTNCNVRQARFYVPTSPPQD